MKIFSTIFTSARFGFQYSVSEKCVLPVIFCYAVICLGSIKDLSASKYIGFDFEKFHRSKTQNMSAYIEPVVGIVIILS